MTLLAMHCLNALCDDYENVASIIPDVRRATHFAVLEEDIEESIRQLVSDGLATVFAFDAEASKYVPTDINAELSKNWFFITDKGRTELDRHWVDDESPVEKAN